MKTAIILLAITVIGAFPGYAQYCDPPGEMVGITEYSVQAYGASSQRIAFDSLGGIHITWTRGVSPSRHVYYNYRNADSIWLAPGTGVQVNESGGAGFASMALQSNGAAATAYHNLSNNYARLAVDNFPGFGVFNYYDVPDLLPGGNHGFWPQVAISANGDIHVLITEHMMGGDEYQILAYTRSEDGGLTWLNPVVVDSVTSQVATITASPTGEVAIVYLKPTDYSSYSVVKNDVCYHESSDGRVWDFRYPINITDYLNDNEDIFCPWGQDAAYDDFGDIHMVWVINNIAMDGSFIDDATGLCYYDSYYEIIETITWMPDTLLNCDPGPMNSAIAMPTITLASENPGRVAIGVVFTGFTDSVVSADNNCVGDLYAAAGSSYWHLWWARNITETITPNCLGDCESEEFPSFSEAIVGWPYDAHLTYVMRNYGDDPDTVYYLPVTIEPIVGIDDTEVIPEKYMLLRAYPNPFNSKTIIEFALAEPEDVELTIYDITGAKVETIRRQGLGTGRHSIIWDAKDAASGVYFVRMEAGGFEQSIKMVLLK
ncbi:MAG: T9SS type A sorting domain-containing protein [Candidatus Zixiibacteriota bacterium]|nr:MAG: T9SS type A sorting domain-containing protein [candidate division Zixibacteria bacterium]